MKRLNQVVTLGLALAGLTAPLLATAKQLSVAALVRKDNVSLADAAAAIAISQALGLDAQVVITTGRQYRTPIYALGPVYYFCSEAHLPFDRVWELRKRGHGWGVIAKELGIHPGDFNKMRVSGDFDRYSWSQILQRRYDWRDNDFDYYAKKGVTGPRLVTNVVLSNGDRREFESRLHLRGQPASIRQNGNGRKAKKGRGGGDTEDRGQDHEIEGHGNGHGGDHWQGPGNGNGKGHGNGHGNGHGHGHGG